MGYDRFELDAALENPVRAAVRIRLSSGEADEPRAWWATKRRPSAQEQTFVNSRGGRSRVVKSNDLRAASRRKESIVGARLIDCP